MIRAGALFVAVAISFVIAVLLSLLILMSFHYKILNKENLLQKKLERNAFSALTLLMTEGYTFPEDKGTIDLYGGQSDSVLIRKFSWGVYQIAAVKAFSGDRSFSKIAQYGYSTDTTSPVALYLADLSLPLNLVGKTQIKGTCYLPDAGVKRGYIEGRGFEGETLIDGDKKTSKNYLPPLNKEQLRTIIRYQENIPAIAGEWKEIYLENQDSIFNSFGDTTAWINVRDKIISGKYIAGNIILYSDHPLTITATARLAQVQLYAPAVIFERNFAGELQVFAKDSIIAGEHCRFEYPSALGLIKKDHSTDQPFIKLRNAVSLKGLIFTEQNEYVNDRRQTLISIEPGAIVAGQVYAHGFFELKGKVHGTVSCSKFLLNTYENHLMNATIDVSRRSRYYVNDALVPSANKKNIVQWLP